MKRQLLVTQLAHQRLSAPRRLLSALLFLVLGGLAGRPAAAQTFPAGFSTTLVANGIRNPTALAFAPDGRVFVCQQTGELRVIKNGALLPTPFLTLPVNSSGERGLVGITFDPNFSANQYVYVYYTLASGANNRISRFTASGDVAVPGSERLVLDLDPLSSATNHNGGAMHFGLDGKLYVAVGENANGANAQNLDTYHGKLLRINADGSVPAGNPYAGTGLSAQRQRVWSHGLRNPFTFAVQPGTGRIFVNDVGGSSWEEINDATTSGLNYGWPNNEGANVRPGQTPPFYAYTHGANNPEGYVCAITGGTFFNPASTNYPAAYVGKYFYQDLCGRWINHIDPNDGSAPARTRFATNLSGDLVGLDTGPDGNLYYLSRGAAALYKIVYTAGTTAPVITTQPLSATVSAGVPVTFSVAVNGTAPFGYQWQKNGANIAGATASSYTIASVAAADAGQYRVVVTNSVGSATSNAATLTVTAFNNPPTAQILTPTSGTTYVAGTEVQFSADATDPEDGALPASAFVWQVNFHHNTHVHDGVPFNQGSKTGIFAIPNSGEVADDVFYRLVLTVTDAGGRKTTIFRDVQPQKTTFSLATSPAGLGLTLDGAPQATPAAIVGVEGVLRSLGAPSPQTVNGVTYEFVSWSNGGTQTQTVATPTDDATYTATYRVVPSNGTLRAPENPATTAAGLDYAYYQGLWNSLPDFSTLTPTSTGTVTTFDLTPRLQDDAFAFRYTGYVTVPADGQYTFYTTSDDGSRLYIGSTLVVDNDGLHGAQEREGTIGLQAGTHAFTVTFFERAGGQVLNVRYAGPGITKMLIPASALKRATSTTPPASTLRVPENPTSTAPGLDYAYYQGLWTDLPAFASLTPDSTGTVPTFDLTPRLRNDEFGFRYTGYITVPTDGQYTFYTASDDGSQLFIGSTLVVDNDGLHGNEERSGQIGLRAGTHAVTVTFFEREGGEVLNVSYEGPGLAKTAVPAAALSRGVTPTASPLRTPENPAATAAGLDYAYYHGLWTELPDFGTLTPISTGTVATVDLTPRVQDDEFAFRYTGYVTVPADGQYTFYTSSDDGSRLYLGSTLVVDNDGMHGAVEREGTIGLRAGTHAFAVTFFERGQGQVLDVSYAGPGIAKMLIPAAVLRRAAPVAAQTLANASGASQSVAVQLYPNPAHDEVTISLHSASAGLTQVEVYDVQGRCVARVERFVPAGRHELPVSLKSLANGLYSVAVRQGSHRRVQRLVVVR